MINESIPIAVCRFCGQIIACDISKCATKEEALELGTMNCGCSEALEYQKLKTNAEKLKLEIEQMLTHDDSVHNIKACDTSIISCLYMAVDIMAEGLASKFSITVSTGCKVDISKNINNKFTLSRTVTQKSKREVE